MNAKGCAAYDPRLLAPPHQRRGVRRVHFAYCGVLLGQRERRLSREEIIGDCRLILGDCLEILPTLGKGGRPTRICCYRLTAHHGARRNGYNFICVLQ